MNRLIREFTEFNAQRMGSDDTPMAVHVDNPNMSMDAFDKHVSNIRSSVARLNGILNVLSNKGGIYNSLTGRLEDGLDIKNLKILRMFPSNDIYLDVFITFNLSDNEYYGVIQNFMGENPKVKSEVFHDSTLFPSKEWIIRIKGLLVKAIKQWMVVPPGEYTNLKDIECTTVDSGEMVNIDEGSNIEVIRSYDNMNLVIDINGIRCLLTGNNYFYFNYWFEKKYKDK